MLILALYPNLLNVSYGLKNNPARLAGNMGKEEVGEMKFWTKEEYLTFSRAMMNKEESYHAFEILY